jgi:hypothetical protein
MACSGLKSVEIEYNKDDSEKRNETEVAIGVAFEFMESI